MKDIVTRIVVTLSGLALVLYCAFLWSNNAVIALPAFASFSVLLYWVLIVVGLFCAIVLGVYPLPIKRLRVILGVLGITLVFLGGYVLTNDVSKQVYISDVVRLLGVLLLILGSSGLIIPESTKKHQRDSKVEIIEI